MKEPAKNIDKTLLAIIETIALPTIEYLKDEVFPFQYQEMAQSIEALKTKIKKPTTTLSDKLKECLDELSAIKDAQIQNPITKDWYNSEDIESLLLSYLETQEDLYSKKAKEVEDVKGHANPVAAIEELLAARRTNPDSDFALALVRARSKSVAERTDTKAAEMEVEAEYKADYSTAITLANLPETERATKAAEIVARNAQEFEKFKEELIKKQNKRHEGNKKNTEEYLVVKEGFITAEEAEIISDYQN